MLLPIKALFTQAYNLALAHIGEHHPFNPIFWVGEGKIAPLTVFA